jgi:hypothetical protein
MPHDLSTSSTCPASGSTSPFASFSSLFARQPSACNTCSRWSTSSVVCPRSRLWRIVQDVMTSDRYVTSNSVYYKSSLYVCLRMPKAFSTTPRPRRNFLLYNDSRIVGWLCPRWGVMSHGNSGYPLSPSRKGRNPSILKRTSNKFSCIAR